MFHSTLVEPWNDSPCFESISNLSVYVHYVQNRTTLLESRQQQYVKHHRHHTEKFSNRIITNRSNSSVKVAHSSYRYKMLCIRKKCLNCYGCTTVWVWRMGKQNDFKVCTIFCDRAIQKKNDTQATNKENKA